MRQTTVIVLAILGAGALIALALGLALGLRPHVEKPSSSVICHPPGRTAAEKPTTTTTSTTTTTTSAPPADQAKKYKSAYGKYRKASVQSDNEDCSKIGMDVLMLHGGSAVDSSVATMICQGATLFQAAGIGGGHFMIVYDKEKNSNKKEVKTLLAREVLPLAGYREYFLNHSSLFGGSAVGVPATLHGLYTAWQMYGRLPWASLVNPTIRMCEEGFRVLDDLAISIEYQKEHILKPEHSNLRQVLQKADGSWLKEGDIMRRPRFAATLRIIATDPMSFYNGTLADNIIADIQEAGTIEVLDIRQFHQGYTADGVSVNPFKLLMLQGHGGNMVKEDLVRYQTRIRQPITGRLPNLKLNMYSPEPPSSGVVLQYILRLIDGFAFTNSSLKDTRTSIDTYHKMIEVFKFAFGRRSALADPLFWDITEIVRNMTSEDYINYIRSRIDVLRTRPLNYYDHAYQIVQDKGTSHINILAPDGGAVGVTSTNNYLFGSLLYGTRTAIMFNNEMDDFSIPDGKVNVYGIAASPSNFPEPGKMPMSSMSPSIFLNDEGEAVYMSGASGGPKIISSIAYVALHNLYLGLDLGEAVDTPRLHHQLLPKNIMYEDGFDEDILRGFRAMGHETNKVPISSYVGVLRNTCPDCRPGVRCDDACVHAVSDWRKGGGPFGY